MHTQNVLPHVQAPVDDPRDVISPALNLAHEFGWEYVKIPCWAAEAAMAALHHHQQEHHTTTPPSFIP